MDSKWLSYCQYSNYWPPYWPTFENIFVQIKWCSIFFDIWTYRYWLLNSHSAQIIDPDSIGLHRVENPSHSNKSVSLHLYSPPFNMCHTFDQRTGHKDVAHVTFWSEYGVRELQEAVSWNFTQSKRFISLLFLFLYFISFFYFLIF